MPKTIPQVNPYYLDRMIDKGLTCDIEAGEDIFSASGIKLVAKGVRISDVVRERLLVHKLRKPLEKCVAVRCGVNHNYLLTHAEILLDECTELRPLLDDRALLTQIAAIPLNAVLNGFLSLSDNDEQIFQHCLLVTLTALGLGRKLQCSEEMLKTIATAALMHDLGELYIDPRYLDRKELLTPKEWRHVSVHPVIGSKLACELCGMSPAVGRAILEHHERGDGGGYPRGLRLEQLSWEGHVISAAETIASMARLFDHPLERAELALRLIPGEYDRRIISALREVVAPSCCREIRVASIAVGEKAHQMFARISAAFELLESARSNIEHLPESTRSLIEHVTTRFGLIKWTVFSAGLDHSMDAIQSCSFSEEEAELLMHEVDLILHEIHWRLGELARDVSCRASQLAKEDSFVFDRLSQILHGENPGKPVYCA